MLASSLWAVMPMVMGTFSMLRFPVWMADFGTPFTQVGKYNTASQTIRDSQDHAMCF